MVTTRTTRVLLVVFAPVDVDTQRLTRVLDRTAARMHEFTGAHEVARAILR
jgi:DNA/RNA-binding domain of Phe-tRNA-synthetase-like protein